MLSYLLYRLAQRIALALPLKLTYKIAMAISDVKLAVSPLDRKNVALNLKAIFPDMPDQEVRKIRRRLFRNFAKYLVDFFRFVEIDKAYLSKYVSFRNENYMHEALSGRRGAVIATAHLGNWELGGVVLALSGYPFWAVALPHKSKKVDDFFVSQRESKGVKVIPLSRAMKTCVSVLRQREPLALVGDRDFTENGIMVDFFGKPTLIPKGPAALAIMTDSLIMPGFLLRNADDTFTMSIEKPIEPVSTGDKERDIMATAVKLKDIFEKYIREYPDQWYMFRRFWVS